MYQRIEVEDFVQKEREAKLVALADRLAVRFAERASKHDREGSFPIENFEELRQEGCMKLTVPREFGGDELSLYELVLFLERIAKGDGSTAIALGWHLGSILHFRTTRHWPAHLFERLCRRAVTAGELYNGYASESGVGSPSRGMKPRTVASRTEGGWLLSGRKTYSTLLPIINHFSVSASLEGEGATGDFYVDRSEGVGMEETWDTLGMRSTGSHDLLLDRVFVPESSLISLTPDGQSRQRPNDGLGYLLFIAACYTGLASAARDYTVTFARTYKPDSLGTAIGELPLIQQQIGLIEADLITVRTMLYTMARRWDQEPEQRAQLKADLGLAKYMATNRALQIADRAMRVVGGSSMFRSNPLERIYRDIRAGVHNPPLDDLVLRELARRALEEPGV
ncbi:acyl-CoA dehydrogenase family protein [Paenibacillus sp. Leaf72]|uniref:acyl-CoA dehydrogenase family protein n=1 Tax=Paenibacillus sp. Leaf72 TaxID=1736234 RepID=UPI0006FCD12C|nr:acyl-CoA dehydrogenase family protein [Paenibacillus sp. Leaf72]KQO18452.1 acyl-CoA dehydrogenase [Paenibacillus sp. Leaf72]